MDRSESAAASRPIVVSGWRGRALEGVDPAALLELIRPGLLEGLVSSGRVEFIKDKLDKGSRVFRARLDLGAGEEEVFIKTVHPRLAIQEMAWRAVSARALPRLHHYPIKILRIAFSKSVAGRSFRAYQACVRAGLPVAPTLLCLERGAGPWREEIIVTRGVGPRRAPDARRFFEHVLGPGARGENLKLKRELIRELGRLLWDVRQSGIKFPDFKLHNLILAEPPGQRPRYYIVDLAEAEPGRPRYPERDFLRRFAARLPGFTRSDKIRLLKAYLRAGQDPRPWPQLCQELDQSRGRGRPSRPNRVT